MHKFIAALGGALLLTACGTVPIDIPQAEAKLPIPIAEGSAARPLKLEKTVFHIRPGEDIGRRLGSRYCRERSRLYWGDDHLQLHLETVYSQFDAAMRQANYPVAGNPNALFEDESESKAELIIAASVERLEMEPCFHYDGHQNFTDAMGGAWMRVRWEVYDALAKRVVYETFTEGSFVTDEIKHDGASVLLIDAFRAASANLTADPGFNALVQHPRHPGDDIAARKTKPINMRPADMPPSQITDATAGVVTVEFADGHGSGFIISPDGYVLTNHHVVEQAHFVSVVLASRRRIVGEVLRTDPARDVALIKLAESNLPALRLRLDSAPNIGDTVFAIGTPLDRELAGTVVRGTVSAYRDLDGFKFIQSDAGIHPGNSGGPLLDRDAAVVGLTDLKVHPNEADNLNYFIPIEDALRRLNIHFKDDNSP